MKITVNGKEINFEGKTIIDLINSYDLKPGMIAVEKNKEIIKRDLFTEEIISENDIIELVRFVGGG